MQNPTYSFCNDLYISYNKFIFKIVLGMFHDYDIAEVAVQETFLSACTHEDYLKSHPNVLGWLVVTAKNNGKMKFREKYGSVTIPFEEITSDIFEYNDSVFQEAELNIIANHNQHYQILCLKYMYGYSVEEISKMYHISTSACKMRLKRARDLLRSQMD